MNALVQRTPTNSGLVPHDMNSALRLAEMMSTGKLVPNHLQKSPGDCLMVVEQAMRWGMSPFAVAQSTSVIQGKLMFEGKLVAAALQASGILSSRFDYEFAGAGDTRSVTATAMIRGETKPKSVTVPIKEVKTTNGMWTKQPDQQLIYSANRIWARRFTPEVMLGVYTPEEFNAPSPADTFQGTTIQTTAEPTPQPTQPARSENRRLTFMERVDVWLGQCKAVADVDAVENKPMVQQALSEAPHEVVHELNGKLAAKRAELDGADAGEQADDLDTMPE